MKIKEGFELHDVCGENVLLATGRENIDFSKLVRMNESAALMWRAVIGKDFTVDDMAEVLLAEYDVDGITAQIDADTTLKQWVDLGLVE